ncbi:hypothetical protein RvY_12755 [Ramazzottius varieornatus]|uniref:Cytochrome P450 n=1 Tax=Ramazzottius varieornatus TaxID=947166 RepID=A0A1D1VKK3_RAMVA|nr:hypothetical protein RvY_12755 [Ramazzottius varieornatus]
MFFVYLTAACAIFFLFKKYLLFLWSRGVGEFPPGPWPVPVIGNSLQLDRKKPWETFEKWTLHYGKIFSVLLGDKPTIVVSDLQLIKRAFKDDRFTGRPDSIWQVLNMDIDRGIVLSQGEAWKENRKFTLHALRDLGFGTSATQDNIQEEARKLLRLLKKSNASPMECRMPFATAASNVISRVLFGNVFDMEDENLKKFVGCTAENFCASARTGLIGLVPWVQYSPPYRGELQALRNRVTTEITQTQELLDAHRKSFNPETPRDYIDAFLVAQKTVHKKAYRFTDWDLVCNISDIHAASTETTATFLLWAMIYMIRFPMVQRKAQMEIDKVVGPHSAITFADRENLPYVEAVVHEVFRSSNYGPFLLPHATIENADFEGFVLPIGTQVIANAWHVHRDAALWKEPEEFDPERFILPDGQLDKSLLNNVIVFSVGKRVCPGEILARMEILVFLGSILQQFTIRSEQEDVVPSLERVNGLALTPHPYRCRFIPRGPE